MIIPTMPLTGALRISLLLLLSLAYKARSLFTTQPTTKKILPKISAAVIVPGFLTGASEFQPLADALTERGIPTVAVPMPNWHWIPCIGGRSMRPMLERIDYTVRHFAVALADASIPLDSPKALRNAIPKFDYSIVDCFQDFQDNPGGVFEVGGSAEVDLYDPSITPRGRFPMPGTDPGGRIALIGHSAGGWISRVYLSDRNYGGRAYCGSNLVHSIVTLGSPHGNAPGMAFKGVEWCNREAVPPNVNGLAVAGAGYPGDRSGDFTKSCYAFCCNDGTDGTGYDGDGVTPVHSALAMEGAEKMVLDGVTHFPWSDVFGGDIVAPDLAKRHRDDGIPWYGSDEALDQWVPWLEKNSTS